MTIPFHRDGIARFFRLCWLYFSQEAERTDPIWALHSAPDLQLP